jgi:hypothetical protein
MRMFKRGAPQAMAMASNAVIERENGNLNDEIVSTLVSIGCACPTDLAAQIGHGIRADDLMDPLESLVKRGILRHKVDPSDPRKYTDRYQTVYELAR